MSQMGIKKVGAAFSIKLKYNSKYPIELWEYGRNKKKQ